MIAYTFASIGFALIIYGLCPLSDSKPLSGYVSEHGALACIIGIAILSMVGVVKVLS